MPETTERTGNASDERKRLRHGLLDQLRHLVREVEMLEGVIGRVPEKLLAEAPPGEALSIKETFGLVARLDEAVHTERLARIAAEDTPRLAPPDEEALLAEAAWNERPVAVIFERVRAARRTLADAFEAVPPEGWLRTGLFPPEEAPGEDATAPQERDLYWMAHALCQRDTVRLERMTRRLYESHMGPAPDGNGRAGEGEHKKAG